MGISLMKFMSCAIPYWASQKRAHHETVSRALIWYFFLYVRCFANFSNLFTCGFGRNTLHQIYATLEYRTIHCLKANTIRSHREDYWFYFPSILFFGWAVLHTLLGLMYFKVMYLENLIWFRNIECGVLRKMIPIASVRGEFNKWWASFS